jgi:alpha-tubulin suppressor-like RCC1 family protein
MNNLRGRVGVAIAVIVLAFATSGCTLWGWGNNASGQIGDGTSDTRLSPSPAPPIFANWLSVSAGEVHSCGLRLDSTLWCWGENSHRQLGFNSPNDQALPVAVGSATWRAVDAGGVYSCAVKSDATLWCWGLNGSGQFGNGTTNTTPNATPSQSGTATWKTVSASNTGIVAIGGHTCGIQTNDTLWCWGVNSSGQVGDGTDEQRLSPAQVGTATWRTVSAGTAHTCAIRTDQTLWCWGWNGNGRLGDGTTEQRDEPVQIGTALWKSVAAGHEHTCGIKTDNTLWCWGSSNSGQVGDGGLGSRFAPVQIGTAPWKAVSAGGFHTCGVRTDGTLWCWGDNIVGQIGIGTQTIEPSPTPAQVGTSTQWFTVTSGLSHSNALMRPAA